MVVFRYPMACLMYTSHKIIVAYISRRTD